MAYLGDPSQVRTRSGCSPGYGPTTRWAGVALRVGRGAICRYDPTVRSFYDAAVFVERLDCFVEQDAGGR